MVFVISNVVTIALSLLSFSYDFFPTLIFSILFTVFIKLRIDSLRNKYKRDSNRNQSILIERIGFSIPITMPLSFKLNEQKLILENIVSNKNIELGISLLKQFKVFNFKLGKEVLAKIIIDEGNKYKSMYFIISRTDSEKINLMLENSSKMGVGF